MIPKNVNPRNFKVHEVLFDNLEFSVVHGVWEDGKKYLAMRWNGNSNNAGYPKTFGHPVWFLIPNELKIPIVKSLIGLSNTDKKTLLKVMDEIL